MTDERTLAFLRELERADEAAAAVLAELDELARAADEVHARAVELEAIFVKLPAERERSAVELGHAAREAAEAREVLAGAAAELAAAERGGSDERRREARRAETKARDALRMAERKLEAALAEERRLADLGEDAEREQAALETRARALAGAVRKRPGLADHAGGDPAPGLAGVAEWASRARAALFVARGRLVAEREGLIRQANELGALVLGEPLTAASPSLIARRVERAAGSTR